MQRLHAIARALEHHAPTWRHTIGLVLETLREQLEHAWEHLGLDELTVDGSNTVDGVRPHNGQVGHADTLLVAVQKKRHQHEG